MSKQIKITCEVITKMSENIRAKKLKFFAKVAEEISLEILKLKKRNFQKLRNINMYKDATNELIELASLILAIDEYMKTISEVSQQAINLKDKNRAKKNTKSDFLAENWSKVKELKNDIGYSFRNISEYFKKYHRFSIAHTTIQNKWKKLEN